MELISYTETLPFTLQSNTHITLDVPDPWTMSQPWSNLVNASVGVSPGYVTGRMEGNLSPSTFCSISGDNEISIAGVIVKNFTRFEAYRKYAVPELECKELFAIGYEVLPNLPAYFFTVYHCGMQYGVKADSVRLGLRYKDEKEVPEAYKDYASPEEIKIYPGRRLIPLDLSEERITVYSDFDYAFNGISLLSPTSDEFRPSNQRLPLEALVELKYSSGFMSREYRFYLKDLQSTTSNGFVLEKV